MNKAIQTGLKVKSELGPGLMKIEVLSRANTIRKELRYARSYALGMVLEVVIAGNRGSGSTRGAMWWWQPIPRGSS